MGKIKKEKQVTRIQSTQQQVPVSEIYKGMIITNDKRYVKILEIKPVQFFLKSPAEQNGIYYNFFNFLRILPKNVQFISLSLPADLSNQLRILERDKELETVDKCAKMDDEFAERLLQIEKTGITRRFFIVFEYEKKNANILKKVTKDVIASEMDAMANTIKFAIESCGNEVIERTPKNKGIIPGGNYIESEILYTFFNRGDKNFEDRLIQANYKYYDAFGNSDFFLPPAEYLAPLRISFSNSKYLIIDGNYYSFLYIPSRGYTGVVNPGWLNLFINTFNGVDVEVFLQREDRSIKRSISKNIVYSRTNANDKSDTSESFDESMKTLNSAQYLRDGINEGQDFYYISTLISVCGSTPEEVDNKISVLKDIAEQNDFILKECKYEEETAFKSYLPLCKLDQNLFRKMKRNVLSEGAATIYPFITSEINDEDGIFFGDNLSNNSLAIIDNFNTKRFTNANIFLCGKSGAGKTFSLSLMALRMRLKHIPVFILAPEKQHEFIRLCDALGGEYIQIGPGSPYRLNIMDITERDEEANLIDSSIEKSSYLNTKVGSLTTFFKLLVPNMSADEIAFLEEAIVKTYKKYGITEDNDSLYDPRDFTRRTIKQMPIIQDLRDVLLENEITKRLGYAINRLCTGSGSCFNGRTNVNLNNEFIVIGLETLEGDLLPLGIYTAMEYVWGKAKEDRTKRKALIIDEWWKMASNQVAAEYSYKMAKLVRAYSMSMILATQQITDIMAAGKDSIGKAIIGNCSTKILMTMENADIRAVKEIVGLNQNQIDIIKQLERGEALFTASGNDFYIKFNAGETEKMLITTDRKDIEKLNEEAKAKRKNKKLTASDIFED